MSILDQIKAAQTANKYDPNPLVAEIERDFLSAVEGKRSLGEYNKAYKYYDLHHWLAELSENNRRTVRAALSAKGYRVSVLNDQRMGRYDHLYVD